MPSATGSQSERSREKRKQSKQRRSTYKKRESSLSSPRFRKEIKPHSEIKINTVKDHQKKLGLLRLNNFTTIDLSRKGIAYKEFYRILLNYGFSKQKWAEILNISVSTLKVYENENRSFDSLQSEKIIMLDYIFNKGVDTFSSVEKFKIWLNQENEFLKEKKPIDFLDTGFGIFMIDKELTKIEFGIFV